MIKFLSFRVLNNVEYGTDIDQFFIFQLNIDYILIVKELSQDRENKEHKNLHSISAH